MQKKEENIKEDKYAKKAGLYITTNMTLVFISVTLFTLIVAINSNLLKEDIFLAAQIVLQIPFIIYSSNALSRVSMHPDRVLDKFGIYTHAIGYCMFINSIGIIINLLVSTQLSIIFFSANIAFILVYGALVQRIHLRESGKIRISKELLSLAIVILLGLFHVIGLY